jgi:hypothetical protein
MPILDLTGKTFGRLTVIKFAETKNYRAYWHCRCECGKEKVALSKTLTNGMTRSCGCLNSEMSKARSTTHGCTVGGEKSPEYKVWMAMKKRCTYTEDAANYKDRGITVCERWSKFENFLADMGPRPPGRHGKRPMYTLDRENNDKGYFKENCRWATWYQQAANRRAAKCKHVRDTKTGRFLS